MRHDKRWLLAANVVAALVLAPTLDQPAASEDQPGPLPIAVTGFNPAEESGVFELADCQGQGEKPHRVELKISGIEIPWLRGLNAVRRYLADKRAEVRKVLEKELRTSKEAAAKAHAARRKIHMVGHSWGCPFELKLAWELKKDMIPVETMIIIDPVTLLYPLEEIGPPRDGAGRLRVADNVKTVFIVGQKWDMLEGGAVVIDDPQKTRVVGQYNLRGDSLRPTEEERILLQAVREDFRRTFRRELKPGTFRDLHTFLDDSDVITKLAGARIGRPCSAERDCKGKLSGSWMLLTAAPSTSTCTHVDCHKHDGVCTCDTERVEDEIPTGFGITGPILGVCHDRTIVSANQKTPSVTVTLYGTVTPTGHAGLLDDRVSFAHEARVSASCGEWIFSVTGEGTVTDESGRFGTPTMGGKWRRTVLFVSSCPVECPPPGGVWSKCDAKGTFEAITSPR